MEINAEDFNRLASHVTDGNCVAFVGAGFSAPLVPTWKGLLTELADSEAGVDVRGRVASLLATDSARNLEVAAQHLEDTLGPKMQAWLRKRLSNLSPGEAHKRRCELLRGIPFSAVLTTNFDGLLTGEVPGPETYERLLRPSEHRWWNRRFWDGQKKGPAVVKIHGDAESRDDSSPLVLTRRGYRARLYGDAGYVEVLRSVFLTKTVLFLGFSFTDDYINALRSEVLFYVQGGAKAALPHAYALVADMDETTCGHYRDHEGLQAFSYSTTRDGHGAFDSFLEGLHAQTNPKALLGARLSEKRLLWVDANPKNNDQGKRFLESAAAGRCVIEEVGSWSAASERLGNETFDLVISRWGHRPGGGADAVDLLGGIRAGDIRVPVLVFASGAHAAENRERALRLGALEYVASWESLFQEIERRFRH